MGYNHPYKGVELVRRHSAPGEHRHSIQIEVNRALYMDEQSLATHAGYAGLQRSLESLVAMLTTLNARDCNRPFGERVTAPSPARLADRDHATLCARLP